jgi:hypothetical protein
MRYVLKASYSISFKALAQIGQRHESMLY